MFGGKQKKRTMQYAFGCEHIFLIKAFTPAVFTLASSASKVNEYETIRKTLLKKAGSLGMGNVTSSLRIVNE